MDLTMGEKIKMLCDEEGITQCKLAQDLGLYNTHVSDMIHGRRSVGIKNAIKIADYFNVSLDWLYGRKSNEAQYDCQWK